jgi:hypothetical protein
MSLTRRTLLKSALATAVVALADDGAASDAGPMKPSTSLASFQEFLKQQCLAPSELTVSQLVESALSFYQSIRATGLATDAQSDMLLFQWGVFDWGHGERFEFDITRQFISSGAFGDDAISQLHCTAYFPPTPELRAIPVANSWCRSVADVESFSAFIRGSAAYRAVSSLKPAQVSLLWEQV